MRNKTIALGLGSNIGTPVENLRRALDYLKKSPFLKVEKVSAIYESEALLPAQALPDWNRDYLNAVVLCRVLVDCTPEELLRETQKIESEMGRKSAERWAPRSIDIDLLYWNLENYLTPGLQVPHRNLLERPFALLPLLEVWDRLDIELPDWSHSWWPKIPFNTRRSVKHFWPRLVAIVNVTDDSFSDGGQYHDSESLQQKVATLTQQGADIIEVGAESTRPGATAISPDDEFKKLNWALKNLNTNLPISLDCRNPEVMQRVLEHHRINFLNDVAGFENSTMQNLLLSSQLPAFVMHSLGIPPNSEMVLEPFLDPYVQLTGWWVKRRMHLLELGIPEDRLIFDPGIGFGKSHEQNWTILRHLENFYEIKTPIMIGHSRKSFLTTVTNRPAHLRDLETALVTKDLNLAYIQYLRVHDIKSQCLALSC